MLLIPLVGPEAREHRLAHGALLPAGAHEYVRLGPPHVLLRMLVGPVLVLATLILFGTGVALLVRGETHGTIVTLHQAVVRRLDRRAWRSTCSRTR